VNIKHRIFMNSCMLGMGLLLLAGSASAVSILLDLHTAAHGSVKTDGVAYFQDNHVAHSNATTSTLVKLGANESILDGFNYAGVSNTTDFPDVKQRAALTLDNVGVFNGYRVFLFDGNQSQTAGGLTDHIDLLNLEIYTHSSDTITSLTGLRSLATLAYKMDDGSIADDYTVRIEGRQGSGKADVHVFIPETLFTVHGTEASTFVYLYSELINNTDGDEHWNTDTGLFSYIDPTEPVPLPSTLWLSVLGMGLLLSMRSRIAQAAK